MQNNTEKRKYVSRERSRSPTHSRRNDYKHERTDTETLRHERKPNRSTVENERFSQKMSRSPIQLKRDNDYQRGSRDADMSNHDRKPYDKKLASHVKTEPEIKPKDEKIESGPNFELSGALTAETNTVNGVVVKYSEPPEAAIPKTRWRLYPFKGDTSFKVLHLHRQSAYMIGRNKKISEILVEHPSCSSQHAVFQFRRYQRTIRPYIIDLDSTNGTFLNGAQIEPRRYIELRNKDVLKFGFSSREYVLLNDKAIGDTVDSNSPVTENREAITRQFIEDHVNKS